MEKPDVRWAENFEACFARACSAGPLSTIHREVEQLGQEQWPGAFIGGRWSVIDRFVLRLIIEKRKWIHFYFAHPWEITCLYRDPEVAQSLGLDENRLFLLLISSLYFMPFAWNTLGLIPAEVGAPPEEWKTLMEKRTFYLWPEDRWWFEHAARLELIHPGPRIPVEGIVWMQAVLARRDARWLARQLLSTATHFPGPDGGIVVLGCGDPRSVRTLEEGRRWASVPRAEREQAWAEKAGGPRSSQAVYCRMIWLEVGKRLGWSSRSIAQAWLHTGCSTPFVEDEEDRLENTERQVKRLYRKIRRDR